MFILGNMEKMASLNNKDFKKTQEACFSSLSLMKALPAYLELCTGSSLDDRKKQHPHIQTQKLEIQSFGLDLR